MKYNVGKNWINSFELMAKHSIVILPFIFIAFLEALALELIYFSPRRPISFITNPIIRKFFGEAFIHYPAHLVILSNLFYYVQSLIYVALGVFLTAVCINIFKNIQSGLPVIFNAIVKNSLKRYAYFFIYGIIIIALIFLAQKVDTFFFSKLVRLVSKFAPQIPPKLFHFTFILVLFFSNVIMQVLVISVIPLIVLEQISFFKAVGKSLYLGFRHFFTIFSMLLLPFLAYLPFTILKSFPAELANKLFPEINVYIAFFGIVATVFLDSFIIICVSQFLMDRERVKR